jgi:hypothetical protein
MSDKETPLETTTAAPNAETSPVVDSSKNADEKSAENVKAVISDWDDKRFTCPVCEKYMYFCSHCRVCGRAVCTSCVEHRPERWLAADYIEKYDRLPENVAAMKTCPDCGRRCEAAELAALWQQVILPHLTKLRVPVKEWSKAMEDLEPKEPVAKACQAMVERHEHLVNCNRFACDQFELHPMGLTDGQILAADPEIRTMDVVARTPKYQKVENQLAVDLPSFLFASLLSQPAAAMAVQSFLQRWPKYIAVLFPIMHPANQELAIHHVNAVNSSILMQHGFETATLAHTKKQSLRTMTENLVALQTFLCLEQTEEARQQACAHFLGRNSFVHVRNRSHTIGGLLFFQQDQANDSSENADIPGCRHTPRVKITCRDKRVFHACFGDIGYEFLHAAAFADEANFGRHFRRLFRLPNGTYSAVFDERDFQPQMQGRTALSLASSSSRATVSLLITLMQCIHERRISLDKSRWTVDRDGVLVLYDLQWQEENDASEVETKTPENEQASLDMINKAYAEMISETPECVYWILRILFGKHMELPPVPLSAEFCVAL